MKTENKMPEKLDKQEFIGKVRLDYTWYSGEDLYTDGEIENRLLEIAKSTPEAALNAVIAEEKDWAVLYHMSHIRENVTDAVTISKDEDVLEIGSGCGAVTGSLARRAHSVTCIDLSRKRSLVNAYRHRDLDNVEILVGNFRDIEEGISRKFDCITLIGVFEYGAAYIGGKDPYGEFLRRIRRHLKPDGRLIIAIENRLGLKYWAGAREDHTGGYFDGLEDYPGQDDIHTFSRPELEEILSLNGFPKSHFYYPYPDYKLPTVIYSDDYLPRTGSLNTNIWNFDRDRLILFDETKVFNSLIRSGLFSQFSNSFLVIAGSGEDAGNRTQSGRAVYIKFSNDRSRRFSVNTQIRKEADGTLSVVKEASFDEGWSHISNMARHSLQLQELFAGSILKVNRAVQEDNCLRLEYLPYTRTLADEAAAAWKDGRKKESRSILQRLCSLIESRADAPFTISEGFCTLFSRQTYPYQDRTLPVTDLDMIADNVLIDPDTGSWTLIDYEWTVDYPIPVRFVLFRIWHYFHAYYVDSNETDEKVFMEEAGFTWPEVLLYLEMEQAWQERIDLEHHPLRTLYAQITPGCKVPREVRHAERNSADPEGTAYFGLKGDGHSSTGTGEKQQPVSEKVVRGIRMNLRQDTFETVLSTKKIGAVSYIRWDPVSNLMCRMKITQVISPVVVKITPLNGFRNGEWDEFWSLDPAYLIEGDIPDRCRITLKGRIEMIPVAIKLPDMDAVRRERDGLALQVQDLSAQLLATRSTKAFRAVEKLRRVRNFVMARVRALPPFRVKVSEGAGDQRYQKWFAEHSATQEDLELQRKLTLPKQPKISILVPTWNTPEKYLREMIDSVQNQTYTNWELCIADASVAEGGSRNEQVAAILKEYAAKDSRIRYVLLDSNLGISGNTNAAAKLACGDYVGLLDHDDILAPDALFEVAAAVNAGNPDVLYTDEDKINMEGTFHFDPNLKPDFAPDLLRSHNYITHFFVARRSLLEKIGYFRKEYDGAQDYDLILRATEQTDHIVHIPKILYYWRNHPGSTSQNPESKLYAYDAGTRAIAASLERTGDKGTVTRLDLWGLNHVRYDTPSDPLISVIIPNKDHIDDLKLCIESMITRSTYRNFELVVVENNSTQPETFAFYEEICKKYPQVRVVRWEKEFNYSAINNFGAEHAKGDYLLLLNNDTELIEPDSLGEMLGICMRSEIGCVGAKLLFADDTVQHCGIILGPGGFAGHVFSGIKDTDYGFMMRAQMTGNWSAVTAACLMIRREVYEQVGGLTEDFKVALNDVDLCMKIRAANYRIVCTPFAKWHHFESKSRGYEDTPEKKARFEQEVKRFRDRWGDTVDAGDPYYNANLSVDRLPFSLW